MVTGTKVITGNRDVDFASVAPFEGNDEKIISDENVVNAITCGFPCKILKNFTLGLESPYLLSQAGYDEILAKEQFLGASESFFCVLIPIIDSGTISLSGEK